MAETHSSHDAEAAHETNEGPRDPADLTALIRAAQEGDRQAATLLVEAYWDRLFRWLYRLTGDRHRSEDLAQDAFVRALEKLRSFRAGTNFRAWLFRIAYNAFANEERKGGRRGDLPPEALPDDHPGPETEAISRETLARLQAALDRLPVEFRAPLLLNIEERLSFREIGEAMGLKEATARWRVFRARQLLLELLGDDGC